MDLTIHNSSIHHAEIFQETELRKLTGLVHDQNTSSLKLLDKRGFKREGLLRKHFLIKNQAVDHVYFGILKSEWRFTWPSSSLE